MDIELDGDDLADAPDSATSAARASNRRYFRNLILGALGLVLVCGAIVALSSSGDRATEASTDAFDEVATTAPDPDQLCIEELSAWMPWVTGPGSTMDAAAEWGMNSEEYKIIVTSWSTFTVSSTPLATTRRAPWPTRTSPEAAAP